MSRQHRWQMANQKRGKCVICGQKRKKSKWYCPEHLIAHRERQRKRMGHKRRYNSISYGLTQIYK